MLRLDVAVERQITVVENRVTAPSHADERLAEHGALDQLFGRLGELANGKVELSTGHQTRNFPRIRRPKQYLEVGGLGGQRGHQRGGEG
jgi:hypothetical protein